MIKKKIVILLIFIFFSACESFKTAGKVLRNEKISNNDEFLVQKKSPLIEPPNLNELPVPDSLKKAETEKAVSEYEIAEKLFVTFDKVFHVYLMRGFQKYARN